MTLHLTAALETDAELAERVQAAERDLNAAIEAAARCGVSVLLGIASQIGERGQWSDRVRVTRIERARYWITGREAVQL